MDSQSKRRTIRERQKLRMKNEKRNDRKKEE